METILRRLWNRAAELGAACFRHISRTLRSASVLAACLCIPAQTASAASYAEHEIKAAYLYNFTKFVEWPDGKSLLHLCLLSKGAVSGALEALKDKTTGERKLVLVYPGASSNLAECDMLFLSEAEDRHLERILAITLGSRVLVVGDGDGYARRGTMFNFFQDGERIRFEINYAAVRRSGLRISSRLLSLGKLVD